MELDNQFYELEKACKKYSKVNQYANYVLYAMQWYIKSERASLDFDHKFCSLTSEQLIGMIKRGLKDDKSDRGIIKSINCFMKHIHN